MSMRTLAAVIVVALASLCTAAAADEFKAGAITIDAPWARPSIGETTNSAAYMKLSNSGDTPDKLLAVKSDAAGDAMLHESRMEDGIMKMLHVDGIEIPAHGSAELKPLGFHVMLMGLKQPLKAGATLPLTLVFEKQGEVKIDAQDWPAEAIRRRSVCRRPRGPRKGLCLARARDEARRLAEPQRQRRAEAPEEGVGLIGEEQPEELHEADEPQQPLGNPKRNHEQQHVEPAHPDGAPARARLVLDDRGLLGRFHSKPPVVQ